MKRWIPIGLLALAPTIAFAQQAPLSIPVTLSGDELTKLYILAGQAEAQELAGGQNADDAVLISARAKLLAAGQSAKKAADDAAAKAAQDEAVKKALDDAKKAESTAPAEPAK